MIGRDVISTLQNSVFKHYYPNTEAIIFMLDSNDRKRIDEAKFELHQ